MPKPAILAIILDGVGDRPHPDFDGLTPLQAAGVPNLDALAARGATGLIDPLGPGIVPGSGTGHLGLFDYDPLAPGAESPSRGAIEALGLGIEPAAGRVAVRGNFVTLDGEGRIQDRRAGRFKEGVDQAEAAELIAAMNDGVPEGVRFHYHAQMGYRFAIVLEDASPAVSDTDPVRLGARALPPAGTDGSAEADATAALLGEALEAAGKVLAGHPVNEARRARGEPVANGLVTRGAGALARGTTLEQRFGVRARAVAGGNAYRGIAAFMGMTLVEVEGATGDLKSDYGAKVQAAVDALGGADLVYLHIKGPDICGENGDFEGKVAVLERIDAALWPVLERGGTVIGLTGDHSTPCTRASHSGDPVPLLVDAPGVRRDTVARYDEIACTGGSLGRLRGGDFLRTLLDLADRTQKRE